MQSDKPDKIEMGRKFVALMTQQSRMETIDFDTTVQFLSKYYRCWDVNEENAITINECLMRINPLRNTITREQLLVEISTVLEIQYHAKFQIAMV